MDYSHGVLKSMCSPFFPQLRQQLGPFLVDKTKLIETIVNNGLNGNVNLVLRPRRCGKTTMLHMLRSFFSIPQNDDDDPHSLFHGLYIAAKEDLCRRHMGRYPAIFCDFKDITGDSWEEMFWSFRAMVSDVYKESYEYLGQSLDPEEKEFFESIRLNTAPVERWRKSLKRLSYFLARKSGRKAMVFIDEYEAPNNRAYELGFFAKANEFFGRGVLPALLKSNRSIEYAILAGVTPVAKAGWYSGLNNLQTHALHRRNSIFAGMVMFTETEVLRLRTLSERELALEDLKAHYNSYLAAGSISVYNPVSIMSAFEQDSIENFWVATGEYPLLSRNFPEDVPALDAIETLLSGAEVPLKLEDSVTFSISTLGVQETLTLLYYAGYLTMTPTGQFKIPNREVMVDWARWITGGVESYTDILDVCVEGHVNIFAERWPIFMQQHLDPKTVAKTRGAVSFKTPERIYQVYFLGLMHCLRPKGWEVSIEPRAGGGYIDIRLVSRKKGRAVLIELKSSEKPEHIERDALKALDQIVDKNYRNQEGLPNIGILREYGIASYHLASVVKGRYLELDVQRRWVEKDDPAAPI